MGQISSEERLLHYGIGQDTYAAYKTLSAFGLLNVHHDEGRRSDGKVIDYKMGVRPRLDAFKLEPDGFEESALDVMKEYLELTGSALQVERGLPHREQFADLRRPRTQPLRTPDEQQPVHITPVISTMLAGGALRGGQQPRPFVIGQRAGPHSSAGRRAQCAARTAETSPPVPSSCCGGVSAGRP